MQSGSGLKRRMKHTKGLWCRVIMQRQRLLSQIIHRRRSARKRFHFHKLKDSLRHLPNLWVIDGVRTIQDKLQLIQALIQLHSMVFIKLGKFISGRSQHLHTRGRAFPVRKLWHTEYGHKVLWKNPLKLVVITIRSVAHRYSLGVRLMPH